MTRVVIVEDHTLLRQSLVKIVSSEPGFEVAGEADRGDRALELIRLVRPDLVLLDITMPGRGGLEVAEEVRGFAPKTRLLFLTMHEDDATIARAIEIGADGYVAKTASSEILRRALRDVAEGGTYLSPGVARLVMGRAGSKPPGGQLTPRELEILRLMAEGARPSEAAERLFLSVKTVKNHLTSIYTKLGVRTGAQAVAEAYRQGLVPVPPKQ